MTGWTALENIFQYVNTAQPTSLIIITFTFIDQILNQNFKIKILFCGVVKNKCVTTVAEHLSEWLVVSWRAISW